MTTTLDDADLDRLLARLSLAQKVRLLTGADFWSLHAEPAIGLRALVMSDGPAGVRGAVWDERDPSLNLPSGTALAASWDPGLAYRYGAAMAQEARRKGVDVVLGPTINLHRSPLGGRHFEAFSEDPLLTGVIAAAVVRGLQDNGVAACPKHYVANDFETERFTASVDVSAKALHEVYLQPFEQIVTGAGSWAVMSAYNAVDGVTMSEHDLLRSPLKSGWGFDGVVVSDWMAVRSLDAARAAQDVVMPGPDGPWGDALVDAVEAGEISADAVDDKVRRLLLLAARVGALELAQGSRATADAPRDVRPDVDPDTVLLAREVEARGIVLASNDGVLPLQPPDTPGPRRIAVLGQAAVLPRTQGGGSATVVPSRVVTPVDGLRAALPDVEVAHATGALVHQGLLPFDLDTVRDPETGEPGVRTRFLAADGAVVLDEARRASTLMWLGDAPDADVFEVVADFTPPASGPIELGFAVVGDTTLEVDGEQVLQAALASESTDLAAALMSPPAATTRLTVEAGRTYRLRWRHPLTGLAAMSGGPTTVGALGFTAGWRPVVDSPAELIAEAAALAREADVAVVVVGTNEDVESEGFDRRDLRLPGAQDDLVRAVAAAQPHTVVVVNSGSPVLMPWRDEVGAVLLTWFGGQEYGNALAEVLVGHREPSGRLPTTWPAAEEDVPVLDVTPRDGVLRYAEGIHVGYRAWLRSGATPAYPFGHGLGYTSWSYDAVRLTADGHDVVARVTITNTGLRRGREVVQAYLERSDSVVERPALWLAGWAVVEADPGEHVTAEVRVAARAFQHWDVPSESWAAEPGEFTLRVGRDVTADRLAVTIVR
ncbi:glycoside hydrolase family 3 C-terminal domain-containing protein [Cellulomonas cellasea]|uniref:beta-glucosidase family protein n=1 Tax=Cellulomonas cellasea TaxID=43670 RepID=UPI0025A32576|nr:glycoside hydrolase family 3 C-terminal domain-containing protein [Cellulomonas cellasea]MDM8084336.1 glycoside hydrolase family 3 C-terminal domain-containing protein [Cellulomonas cellasea]